ncbi:MAG: hypothetical protein GX603_03420 [Chloroflexi bacterium]|nr:hypothetical protein [Chloroflexota bacterium]
MTSISAGTWVEIESVVLSPEERAPTVPDDTKQTPYIMWVSGFLAEDARVGDTVRVKTIIGRELSGKLVRVNPNYTHSFGKTVPELLKIGTEWER